MTPQLSKVPSKEETMNSLNKSRLYRCLPEKEPKTKAEYDKAVSEYQACEERMAKKDKADKEIETAILTYTKPDDFLSKFLKP